MKNFEININTKEVSYVDDSQVLKFDRTPESAARNHCCVCIVVNPDGQACNVVCGSPLNVVKAVTPVIVTSALRCCEGDVTQALYHINKNVIACMESLSNEVG